MLRDVDDARQRLRDGGLAAYAEALVALIRPGLTLVSLPGRPDSIGPWDSRLGGLPHLPADVEWPQRDGHPLAFIAQIDLAAALQADPRLPVPAGGNLAFFYDATELRTGMFPEGAEAWRIVHTPPSADLVLRSSPDSLPAPDRFNHRHLRFEPGLWLPAWEESEVGRLGWTPDDYDRYRDVLGTVGEPPCRDRFLGHPDVIQGGMQEDCAIHAAGIRLTSRGERESPEALAAAAQAGAWHLLLQVDSESGNPEGMQWGDGHLYWWIRDDHLAASRYDSAWMELQAY